MNINPVRDVPFDDKATLAMGAAFDQACRSLPLYVRDDKVRALIAKLIIEAAKNGERDPIRIQSEALMEFSIDDVSVPVVSIARDIPVPNTVPVYALIACTA
jgi:hypothetical protein